MSVKIYRVIGNEGRVTIPCVLRACVGFEPNDVVSFEMISEDTVLVRREQLVEQPVSQPEMPSLKELLEGLTESQQRAARCYLSILCADGGKNDGREGF